MTTILCLSLLALALLSDRDPLSRKRRQWRAESDIGPALQERWLRK